MSSGFNPEPLTALILTPPEFNLNSEPVIKKNFNPNSKSQQI